MTKERSTRSDDSFEQALFRLESIGEASKQFRDCLEVFASGKPQTIACPEHPHVIRRIDLDESSRQSWEHRKAGNKEPLADKYSGLKAAAEWVLVYSECPECAKDAKSRKERSWFVRCGVPPILEEASFKTFRIESVEDEEALAIAKKFAEAKKGFLILTGSLGDGKSFLAAAVLRAIGGGVFITHNDLQFSVRDGWKSPKGGAVIERIKAARCLVLDDLGLSMGGADDIPILHTILDHFHNEMKPVVITSNLPLDEVRSRLGPRMAERLQQSLFRHIKFAGASHRPAMRSDYMQ